MFEKKRERQETKRIAEVKEVYPLYPFTNMDDIETQRQAGQYVDDSSRQHPYGESEWVVRSINLPPRDLPFSAQRVWRQLRRHAFENLDGIILTEPRAQAPLLGQFIMAEAMLTANIENQHIPTQD